MGLLNQSSYKHLSHMETSTWYQESWILIVFKEKEDNSLDIFFKFQKHVESTRSEQAKLPSSSQAHSSTLIY